MVPAHVEAQTLDGYDYLVLLRSSTPDDQPFYVYLRVARERLEALRRKVGSGETVVFRDYGEILHKDWGCDPSEAIKMRMAQLIDRPAPP
jgi:hypothetical protein